MPNATQNTPSDIVLAATSGVSVLALETVNVFCSTACRRKFTPITDWMVWNKIPFTSQFLSADDVEGERCATCKKLIV